MSATRGVNDPQRQPNEFYETPAWATRAMLLELGEKWPRFFSRPPGIILDPGAGSGAITRELRREFPEAHLVAVEIDEVHRDELDPLCNEVHIRDYLSVPVSILGGGMVDLTVGNPPYSGPGRRDLAMEFVEHSMQGSLVTCMLTRLNWLGSKKRHEFMKKHPPYVCVLSRRPHFLPKSVEKHGDSCEYAWMTWGMKELEGTWKVLEI
jgi:hypothetical protein